MPVPLTQDVINELAKKGIGKGDVVGRGNTSFILGADKNLYTPEENRARQTEQTIAPDTTPISRPIKSEPVTPATPSVADIQAQKMREAQAEVDALNKYFEGQIADTRKVGEERLRETASVNTLTGLAGSTEANRTTDVTRAKNEREVQAVRQQQALAIQAIFSKVKESAIEEARYLREEARLDADTAQKERIRLSEEAVNGVTVLSATGVTAEGLKQNDPEVYQHFVDTLGGEDMVKGYFALNRPSDTIIDKRVEGGKYIIAYQNPMTGETKIETVDLGLPNGYSKTIDAGNRILAIPDNWSGDPSELITINKGVSPSSSTTRSNQVIDNERALFTQFKGEPIVKNYNEVVNKKLSVDRIIDEGVGGPADLALVFEFMKALDPTSVVRESEYESAAKSGNIFAGVFAKFNGYLKPEGGFLPEAVQREFQNLVNQKLDVAQLQYDNLAKEYTSISERQGLDPRNVVLNYAGALGATDTTDQYSQYRSQLGEGEILIQRGNDIMAIPQSELQANDVQL